ncbi:hypothetical protein CEQ90_16300 [Lewinellaceae bacterium SD302]|nr:hypothetical protein CEQ90_16300 [Lewinellaceae bacterium SD302]
MIHFVVQSKVLLELWSITGQPIQQQVLTTASQSGNLSLDEADLPTGTYLLRMSAGGESVVQKVFEN